MSGWTPQRLQAGHLETKAPGEDIVQHRLGVAQGSQMPCRVSSDVHEWSNEDPTVPAWYPVNPHNVGEQSTNSQRDKKTPWSFTAARRWGMAVIAERRREPSIPVPPGAGGGNVGTPPFRNRVSHQRQRRWNNGRWAVWLGRHPLEKISRGPKGRLRRDRNPP